MTKQPHAPEERERDSKIKVTMTTTSGNVEPLVISMNTKEQDWENKQIKFLKDVQEEYAQISSEWNGKSPGIKEERAQFANDIYDKCQELIELLQEFDNFD